MEPASKTLYVMLHGINPPQGGLFKLTEEEKTSYFSDRHPEDYACNQESGAAHIFHTFGFTPFLHKEVTAFNHTYNRAVLRPQDSPADLARELGDRAWAPVTLPCSGPRMEYKVGRVSGESRFADPAGGTVVRVKTWVENGRFEVKPILAEAVENWYKGELLKAAARRNNPAYAMDPDLFAWIQSNRERQGSDPSLADLRREHKEWIPTRFVLMVHSMGGLDTRYYVQSDFYQGDIDKVITLDSPQEGSWAAQQNKQLFNTNIDNWLAKATAQGLIKLGMAAGLYTLDNPFSDAYANFLIKDAGLTTAGALAARVILLVTLANGYSFADGANDFMDPQGGTLKAFNSALMATRHPAPAWRIFHHEGVLSMGDPEQSLGNGFLVGALLPKTVINGVSNLFQAGSKEYENIPLDQLLGNHVMAGILGGATEFNFYQGTSVVNATSSKAGSVALFNAPGADVRRKLYSIDSKTYLTHMAAYLGKDWITGKVRDEVIRGLGKLMPTNKILLDATKFTMGLAMGAILDLEIAALGELVFSQNPGVKNALGAGLMSNTLKPVGVLGMSHDYATINSHRYRVFPDGQGRVFETPSGSRVLNPTDLEEFLYEKPYASIAMRRFAGDGGVETIELGIAGQAEGGAVARMTMPPSRLSAIEYSRNDWDERMAIKEEEYVKAADGEDYIRHPKRYFMPDDLVIQQRPHQIDLVVDDVRPDRLETFTFSTNYGAWAATWVRQPDGRYDVFTKGAGGAMVLLRREDCPISPKGAWSFRPDDYLRPGEDPGRIFADGQNVLGFEFVNGAGMRNAQRFFLLWQATPPVIVPHWIKPYAVVSDATAPLRVDVYSNRYRDLVVDLEGTRFKFLTRSASITESGDDVPGIAFDRPGQPGAEEPKVFRHSYSGGALLGADGPYWMALEAPTKDPITNTPAGVRKERFPFHLDRAAPVFAWEAMPLAVNPEAGKAVFGKYSWTDQALGQVHGARIWLKKASDGSTVYEFKPLGANGSGGGSVQLPAGLDEGLYSMVIEGRDAAVPDEAGAQAAAAMLGRIDAQRDGDVSADFIREWEALKARTGTTGAPAFNFSAAETPVFIDRTAPTLAVAGDFPRVVKAGESFRAGFRAVDAAAALPESRVRVTWSFSRLTSAGDLTGRVATTARPGSTEASAPPQDLREEPGMFRLEDGRYRFSLEARDDAGNARDLHDPAFEFSVDRMKPAISGLFPRRQTYRRGDAVILDFTLSEDADAESNRNGLYQGITLTLVEPDGASRTHSVMAHGNGRYSVELPAPPSKAGTHTAILRVRDWAGNLAEDATVFGVDRAVTRISSPGEGAVIDGMVGIYGLAGSPDYSLAAPFDHYELTWSPAGQQNWSDRGMQTPHGYRGASTPVSRSLRPVASEGLLGFWNPEGLPASGYDLRLCSHAGTAVSCDERRIQLGTPGAQRFTVALAGLPASRKAGEGGMEFEGRLVPEAGVNVLAGAGAGFDLRLTVKDAQGNVLKSEFARDVRLTPYEGAPAERSQPGFYLWQDSQRAWHLAAQASPIPAVFTLQGDWTGQAHAVCPAAWTCSQSGQGTFMLPVADGPGMEVSRTLTIQVPQGGTGEITFKFPGRAQLSAARPLTDEQLRAHQENPDAPGLAQPLFPGSLMRLGAHGVPAVIPGDPSDPAQAIMPPLALSEFSGSRTFSWDGLRQDGGFPAPGTATVILTAEKAPEARTGGTSPAGARRAGQAEATFSITRAEVALSAEAASPVLDLNPVSGRRIAFLWRLTGSDAHVSARILRQSNRAEVATLRAGGVALAKGARFPYTAEWDGMGTRGHLVERDAGFLFRVEARASAEGELLASAEVPFTTVMNDWVPAPEASLDLRVSPDETLPTSDPDVVAVRALPKYRITAEVEGTIGETRNFTFTVGHSGTQKVIAYPKERFNLFIRRQRDEVSFWVLGRMKATKRGYRCAVFSDATNTAEEVFFFGTKVIAKRGEIAKANFYLQASDGGFDYAFACDASGCASDLNRTMDLVLLPLDALGDVSKVTAATWDGYFKGTNKFAAYSGISLVNGRAAYNGLDRPAGEFIINRDADLRDPTATCAQDPANPAGGTDGVLEAGEACKSGADQTFDPHRNLAQIGFFLPAGRSKWLTGLSDRYGCAPPKYEGLSFDIGIKVPESYWNPPFGYNNLANRCLRFDPENQDLYAQPKGMFAFDKFDNNGPADASPELGISEMAGRLWPGSVQRYRFVPYLFWGPGSDKGYELGHPDRLSFGYSDHQHTRKDRFQFGFNGKPLLAGSSFQLKVSRWECADNLTSRASECPEGSAITPLLTVPGDAQWEAPATRRVLSDQNFWRHEGSGNSLRFFRSNLVFEVSQRIKPSDPAAQQALVRDATIDWPASISQIDAFNAANKDKRILKAISGIRYGLNDGISEDAFGLPTYLSSPEYVDTEGFLKEGVEFDGIPRGVTPGQNPYITYPGQLSEDGEAVYSDPFRPGIGGSFVTLGAPHVTADPGITVTPVTAGGSPAYRFQGLGPRPWNGSADPQLRGRDLDEDGARDDEFSTRTDLDQDQLRGEDVAGELHAVQVFPQRERMHRIFLGTQLYHPSVGAYGGDPKSLFRLSGGLPTANPAHRNVFLRNVRLSNLDFTPAANLATGSEKDYSGIPLDAAVLEIERRQTLSRAKELLTLRGKADVPDYRVFYLDHARGLHEIDYAGNPSSGADRILGYLDVSRLQGNASLFLVNQAMRYRPDGTLGQVTLYRKADIVVGSPVAPGASTAVSSLHGEAEVAFSPGSVPSETYVTVRPVDLRETGLAERNKLDVIGPVIEIRPSMAFPPGAQPRVRVRLERASLRSTPVSAVQLYKPDGDALVPLSNPLYAFFSNGAPICAENPSGECSALWDEVVISGETPSFSHFVLLDGRFLDQRRLLLTVDPAESDSPERRVAVSGREASEVDLWYDDDPLFDEVSDLSPPVLLPLREVAADGGGFTAMLTLPSRGPGRLTAVPRILNGKTAARDVRWFEALEVRALGPELAVVNGHRQAVLLACAINQPGKLRLAVSTAAGEEEFAWEVQPAARGINVVELGAHDGDRLEEGSGTSRWLFKGLHGAEYQVAGPRFLVDRTPPDLRPSQSLSASEAGDGIRLTAVLEARDRNGLERIHLVARLGEAILFEGEIAPSRVVEKVFVMDGERLAACRGCEATLRWTVSDVAGNQSRHDWKSRPLAPRGTLVFRVDGSQVSAPVANFPLPVRLGRGGAPFEFAGMRPDGSELRALLPNGQPLHLEVETFRPSEGESIVWVTLPELKPGKDAYFTLTLDHSETYGFRHTPKDWDLAAVWHVDRGNPGHDATERGFVLSMGGWRSLPGILGEATTGDGYRPPLETSGPAGDLASGDFTFGTWYRDAAPGTREEPGAVFLAQAGGFPGGDAVFGEADGRLILERGNSVVSAPAAGIHDGSWHHVAFTYAPSRGHRVRFYLDGRLLSEMPWPEASGLLDPAAQLLLGNEPGGGEGGSEAALDEIRLAWTERSPEWIRLEHATQRPGAALVVPVDALPPDSPQPTSAYTLSMRETAGANNASQPQVQIRNNSLTPLSGFTVRLWLSRQEQSSQEIEADAYWFNPSGVRISVKAHPQNANLVAVDLAYPEGYVLPAGASTDIEGAKFGIHFAGYHPGTWDRSNDWSWQGIDDQWRETPFVALLDGTGAVLAGQEPSANAAPFPPVESTEGIFGFEVLSDWSVNGSAASLSPTEMTEGATGLKLAGSGYITVKSRDFNTSLLDPATQRMTVDVKLPQVAINPWWKGSVSLYVDCPSGNQWSAYQGQVELTALPDGSFSTLSFPLTAQVLSLLPSGKRDFSIRIVVNSASPGIVLDRVRMLP